MFCGFIKFPLPHTRFTGYEAVRLGYSVVRPRLVRLRWRHCAKTRDAFGHRHRETGVAIWHIILDRRSTVLASRSCFVSLATLRGLRLCCRAAHSVAWRFELFPVGFRRWRNKRYRANAQRLPAFATVFVSFCARPVSTPAIFRECRAFGGQLGPVFVRPRGRWAASRTRPAISIDNE